MSSDKRTIDQTGIDQSCDPLSTAIAVSNTSEADEYFFREGCYILELWNDPRDPNLSIARARVLPGQSTCVHSLTGTAERYLVLKGQGRFTSSDTCVDLTIGQTVYIPADNPQSIENTGDNDLVFLAICTPRFKPENYNDLDAPSGEAKTHLSDTVPSHKK